MENDDHDQGLIIKMPSAMFATLLLVIIALRSLNNWNVQMACVLTYVVVLAISGWIFAVVKWRSAGFIHAVLMLGIAGMVFYKIMGGILTSPGSDDPVAGVVAAADLVFIVVGVLAALCGIGVAYLAFKK